MKPPASTRAKKKGSRICFKVLWYRIDGSAFSVKLLTLRNLEHFNTGSAEQLNAVLYPVGLTKNHTNDAGLNDQLGTFDARRRGNVEGSPIAAVVAAGNLGYGIGFGVQDIGLGHIVCVFAHVFEAGGRSVVPVADDHLAFYQQGPNLAALTIGVLGPNGGHGQIALIQQVLLAVVVLSCVLFHVVE